MYAFWILTLAIVAGQLIRIPLTSGGITLLDVTVIVFCIIGLYQIKFRLRKPPHFILSALLFILIATISLIFTPLHLEAEQYFSCFLYTVRFALYVFLSWLIYSGALPSLRNKTPRMLVFSGVGLAVLGLLQLLFLPNLSFLQQWGWDPHYFRTVSTFLDPNFLGAFLVLTLLLLLSYLRGRIILTPRVFYFIFAIIYLALLTTFSRSSYLMFLISGLTFSLIKKTKSAAILTVLLFLGLMLGFNLYNHNIAQPRNINRTQSASFRISTWQQGWELFKSHPILGVGFNAYRFGLKESGLADENFLQSHGSSSNDSSLLFVASTTGIIGLLSFLYFLFSLVRINYLGNRAIYLPAIAGLIIHSFFANSLFFPPILFWVLFISVASKK